VRVMSLGKLARKGSLRMSLVLLLPDVPIERFTWFAWSLMGLPTLYIDKGLMIGQAEI
jgi:hypothetical protein